MPISKELSRGNAQAIVSRAIEREEFEVYLQPKIDLKDGVVVGAEALVRWNHPVHGQLEPSGFVPLLIRLDTVSVLDRHVLRTVCKIMREWAKAGREVFPISVNQSWHTAAEQGYEKFVLSAVNEFHIKAGLLTIEVSESGLWQDTSQTIKSLTALRQKGIKISIDDFGSSDTSLRLFSIFEFDEIKLDKTFVNSIEPVQMDQIIKSINEVCEKKGVRSGVIGIDTYEQKLRMEELECSFAQGNLYSKAVPAEQLHDVALKQRSDKKVRGEEKKSKRFQWKEFIVEAACIAMALLVIVLAVWNAGRAGSQNNLFYAKNLLRDSAEAQTANVLDYLKDKREMLEDKGGVFAELGSAESDEAREILDAMNSSGEHYFVVFSDGGHEGTDDILAYNPAYVYRQASNEGFFASQEISEAGGEASFVAAVPVIFSGRAICAFGQRCTSLTAAFDSALSEYDGQAIIISSSTGAPVAGSQENKELFKGYLEEAKFASGFSRGDYIDDLENGRYGYTSYISPQGDAVYAYYMSMGMLDWVMVCAAPTRQILAGVQNAGGAANVPALNFLLILSVIIIAVVYFLNLIQKKNAKAAEQESLRRKKYEGDVHTIAPLLIEYDVAKSTLSLSEKVCRLYELEDEYENVPESLIENKVVHPDDAQTVKRMFGEIDSGKAKISERFRIWSMKSSYHLVLVEFETIFDGNGYAERAIGMINDIDEKEETVKKQMEKQDIITGVLNRREAEKQIREFLSLLEPAAGAALILIDLDDFRQINERYGHLFGDKVLARLGEQINTVFDDSYIKGRCSGNGFIVFIKEISNVNLALIKADELYNAFSRQRFEAHGQKVSISAGIAFREHAQTFEELETNARAALEKAKSEGKDRCVIFSPDME